MYTLYSLGHPADAPRSARWPAPGPSPEGRSRPACVSVSAVLSVSIPRPDRLREELTLAQMERHASELEEMNVEGILAFAERVLPSASNLWVQSSLAHKQRL